MAFVVLTFVFSWAIQVPLALSAQGVLDASPPMWLHDLGSFVPLLAAGAVTLVSRGLAGEVVPGLVEVEVVVPRLTPALR